MEFHHRRHFILCLPLREFLYVGRFYQASFFHYTGSIGGGVRRRPANTDAPVPPQQGRPIFTLQKASGVVSGDDQPTPRLLLYLLFSLGRFVRFAFRFVSTLQGIQGELFSLYRKHRGWCPGTTSQHRCSCTSTARANYFHSTEGLGGGVRGRPANTEVPPFLSQA